MIPILRYYVVQVRRRFTSELGSGLPSSCFRQFSGISWKDSTAVRMELLWDGDVSPQGASANYTAFLGGMRLRTNVLYFIVDETVAGSGQLNGWWTDRSGDASCSFANRVAVGYYDYSLRSVVGASEGDFRSNLFANGRYLSYFNLLDVIAAMTWRRLGER